MNKIIYTLVVVLLMTISGCSILSKPEAASETPTSTEANSIATALPVPRPTESATILVSPEPTLNRDEKETYIKLLLKDNNGCDLPCWWGIEPGKTTWPSVEAMLSHLGVKWQEGISEGKFGYGTGGLGLESIGTSTSVDFSVKQELVEDITISAFGNSHPQEFQQVWEYYSSDKILLKYGKPSRIQLYVSTYGENNNAGYGYWLYYDNLGFLIVYGGVIKKEKYFHICPNFNDNQISELQIYLKSPNNGSPLEAVVGNKGMQLIGPLLKNFEDVTGKSVEEYYNEFLADRKNICFDTSAELWP